MLARDIVQRRETRLDARELGGIEVEPSPVVAQRARGLGELDAGRLQQRDDLGERGVVAGERRQPLGELREPHRQRVVAVGQQALAGRRGLEQRARVAEARLRGGELGPLAVAHRERGELALPCGEVFALGRRGFGGVRRRIAMLDRGAPRAPLRGNFPRERDEAAECVEERALFLGVLERLVRVLTVQVDQLLAQRAELRKRHRVAVDEGPRAALRVEHAAHQHFAVLVGERVLGEPGARVRRVGDVERGRELRPLGAGPDLPHFEAVAEQEPERVEEDRLARTGFAGEHGEPGIELEVERVDEHEVADRQVAEHRASGGGRRGACRR